MKISFSLPAAGPVEYYLNQRAALGPTYAEREDTRRSFTELRLSPMIRKYDYDENRVQLGKGKQVFERAKAALLSWKMFPHWTRIAPPDAPIRPGQRVGVLFRMWGVWWWNSSEIIYTISEERRFGFAYGTLPGHVESGEELFLVEMDDQDQVWYILKAFSRPAFWFVSMVYPYVRSWQRRFARHSLQAMKDLAKQETHA